jgi:hypothetical protein
MHAKFENLAKSNFDIARDCASDPSPNYNCIAWAAGKTDCPWWPTDAIKGYYWPPALPKESLDEETVENFVKAFEIEGYVVCEKPDIEIGFEKVAIYADANNHPLHAARSLANGIWSSKSGDEEDIEHQTLEALSGKQYGSPVAFLKRALNQ